MLAAEEAVGQAGAGRTGDFPGALVHRGAAGRARMAAAPGARRGLGTKRRRHLPGSSRRGRDRPLQALARSLPVRHRGRPDRRSLRHQGLADLAVDGVLLGRDRDPARGRGDPARRDRRRPVHRHRRLGARRSADPVFPAFGAVDPQRSARGRRQALREESRRLRHGRGRRGARHRERRGRARPRRRHSRLRPRLRRARRRLPPHPLEPGRRADHRGDPGCDRGRRPDARRHRLRQRPRHRHARERQDGVDGLHGGDRRADDSRSRSRPTSR